MTPTRTGLIIPILLITFGVGWLLTFWEVAPDIDWPWTLGLAVAGLLMFAVLGIDKVTVVCAPLLLAGCVVSILHQTEALTLGVLVPFLVILAGILLLFARSPAVPKPKWIMNESDSDDDS